MCHVRCLEYTCGCKFHHQMSTCLGNKRDPRSLKDKAFCGARSGQTITSHSKHGPIHLKIQDACAICQKRNRRSLLLSRSSDRQGDSEIAAAVGRVDQQEPEDLNRLCWRDQFDKERSKLRPRGEGDVPSISLLRLELVVDEEGEIVGRRHGEKPTKWRTALIGYERGPKDERPPRKTKTQRLAALDMAHTELKQQFMEKPEAFRISSSDAAKGARKLLLSRVLLMQAMLKRKNDSTSKESNQTRKRAKSQ